MSFADAYRKSSSLMAKIEAPQNWFALIRIILKFLIEAENEVSIIQCLVLYLAFNELYWFECLSASFSSHILKINWTQFLNAI